MPIFPNGSGQAWQVLNATGLRQNNHDAQRAPEAMDDVRFGYERGSRWWHAGIEYVCKSNVENAAEWVPANDASAIIVAQQASDNVASAVVAAQQARDDVAALAQAFGSDQAAQDQAIAAVEQGAWVRDLVDSETSYRALNLTQDEVDQIALGGSKVNGFRVNMPFGGPDATGGRHAIYGRAIQTAATAAGNPDRNYVGVQGHVIATVSDGGVAATLAGGKGAFFGASAIAVAEPGATNLLNLTGFEANSRAKAGSSVAYISGLQIVTKDEVQGAIFDAALAISRGQAATSVGKKHGILFGNMNGALPVADDGTIVGWTGGGTVLHGLDFSAVTITGDLIKGGGARLNKGAVVLGTTAGAEIDASTATSLTYKSPLHAFNGTVRPTGDNAQGLGAQSQRWQVGYVVNLRPGTGAAIWTSGAGTPEGVIVAPVGSLFTRTDGGAGTTLYVKETGTGNTGWVAK